MLKKENLPLNKQIIPYFRMTLEINRFYFSLLNWQSEPRASDAKHS